MTAPKQPKKRGPKPDVLVIPPEQARAVLDNLLSVSTPKAKPRVARAAKSAKKRPAKRG